MKMLSRTTTIAGLPRGGIDFGALLPSNSGRRSIVRKPLRKFPDFSLRLLGTVTLCVAYAALRLLLVMVHPGVRHQATPLELGITAVAFVGASAGSALLLLGEHLFDEVEVSSRWSIYDG